MDVRRSWHGVPRSRIRVLWYWLQNCGRHDSTLTQWALKHREIAISIAILP